MSKYGLAVAFTLLVVLLMAASPASALCAWECTCFSECDQICYTGPDIPDCPGCNESTCGMEDECIGSWGCTSACYANSCTSTINGTSNGDTLTGGSDHECINGFDGADTLTGNAGDDTISGGNGNDTAYGGSGNDCLYGDGGSDNVNGDSGTDLCQAETEATCEY